MLYEINSVTVFAYLCLCACVHIQLCVSACLKYLAVCMCVYLYTDMQMYISTCVYPLVLAVLKSLYYHNYYHY